MNNLMYIVVPCYNEEQVLPETSKRLQNKVEQMIENEFVSPHSRVLFVDDGSRDNTWSIIEELNKVNPLFCGLKLSRNQGHQNALLAGLMTAKDLCDFSISLDADLQDDIEVLDEFVSEYKKGNDIVYGVRSLRKTDTFFKKNTALFFYNFMNTLGVEIVFNHADYRLISKRAMENLNSFKEVNLFLRGIMPLIGYRTSTVSYERNERFAGTSKYPLKKMLAFALNGITSFSIKPIRLITAIGFIVSMISFVLVIYFTIGKMIGGKTVDGWASIICSLWMLGGVQMFSLGIVGEYVGKIYLETKHRPLYFIDKVVK